MRSAPHASPVPPWSLPPEPLLLPRDEVHVWRAPLEQTPSRIQSLFRNLDAEERARAERFHFTRDRQHFIVGRGVLRAILGGYLNRPAACLSFRYNKHGKPALAGDPDADALHFNVAHSGGLALFAVALRRNVGIDLERIRPDLAVAEIADRFFSPYGAAMLRALPADLKRRAFFRYWTHNEAYVKARGEGLSLPLDRCHVSLASPVPAAVRPTAGDPSGSLRWSFHELIPAPGYVAALAVEGHEWRLACWQWLDRTPPINRTASTPCVAEPTSRRPVSSPDN